MTGSRHMALVVLAGLAVAGCTDEVPEPPAATGSPTPPPSTQVVADIERSVVSVEGSGDGVRSTGSGMVLTTDGYVLAPAAVVDAGGDSLTVTFRDGGTGEATAVGGDPRSQLAVIKVSGAADLAPVVFSDGAAEVGDEVRLVAGPLVPGDPVTAGTIQDAGLAVGGVGGISADTGAALGSVGGPLVNPAGEVVGVTVASTSGGDSVAVPSALASRVAEALIAGEPAVYPYLGVAIEDADGGGAVVQEVPAGTPAAQAGLRPGDVITQVGDRPVETAGDVTYAVQSHEVGDDIGVTYTRDGAERDVTVTLGEAPAQ